VLVNKTGRRSIDLPLRYVGFEIQEGWVVGFGMDLDDRFRDLDHIAVIETSK
jgi:hypoxanthine phosphoribosyltransferase